MFFVVKIRFVLIWNFLNLKMMKTNYLKILTLIVLAGLFQACEDEQVSPVIEEPQTEE